MNYYSFIEFTPTTSGSYYLAASTLDGANVGKYVLSAFAGDLPGDDTSPAELQVGGASLTSRISDSGDVDSFAVATVAGEYYTVSVTWSGGDYGHYLVPLIEARGADGVAIDRAINLASFTTQLTFRANATTTWIDVGSEYPGYDIGQYSVHIEEASLVDAIEEAWEPTLPADMNVYFIEGDALVTNAWMDSFYAVAWTPEEMDSAFRMFQYYSDIANITFTVVDDPSAAHLVMVKQPDYVEFEGGFVPSGSAWGWERGATEIDGVFYSVDLLTLYPDELSMSESIDAPGSWAEHVLIHELGHHLGLSHPHPENLGDAGIPGLFWGQTEHGDFGLGQSVYTQMAYRVGFSEKDGFVLGYPSVGPEGGTLDFGQAMSPMVVDIAAVQQLYGANTTTRTGDDVYVLPEDNAPGTGYSTIWDNGGTDTIMASSANNSGVTIDLRAATLDYEPIGGGAVSWATGVWGGFTIANGVVIENAIGGAGNDRLVGNEADNRLEGGAGDDELGGGVGDDILLGGDGNDRLFGDVLPGKPSGIGYGSGHLVSDANAGNDSIETALDLTNAFALFADPDVANSDTIPHVTISGTGNGSLQIFKITLAKGATLTIDMDHTNGLDFGVGIYKDEEEFSLLAIFNDGLVSAGAGGSVSQLDPYGIFTAWDGGTYYVILRGADIPYVPEGESYVLHVSVPAMTADVGSGAGNDILDGGAGDDWLDGGAGRDRMIGGAGNDTFVVDNLRDVVVEERNGGLDTILSSVNLDLGSFARYVENLTLTGTGNLSGYGNALDNVLTGNGGANHLKGGGGNDHLYGGAGKDRLEGGAGNDWLNGGLGSDRLEGGAGRDQFHFSDRLGAGNVDTIVDFSRGSDHLVLDSTVFIGLSVGALSSAAFKAIGGAARLDASDRILYNQCTGDLYFDQDGSGGAVAAIRFASLANHANLSASDFMII